MARTVAMRMRYAFNWSLAIGALAVAVGCSTNAARLAVTADRPARRAPARAARRARVPAVQRAPARRAAGEPAGGAGGSLAGRPKPMGDFTVGTPMRRRAHGPPRRSRPGPFPQIVYPSSETRFPRNIYRTLFQWRTQGMTQFRLSFVGAGTRVTVYSDGTHADCAMIAGAGCWEADEESWFLISYGNAGETVQVTVDGLDATTQPPTVRRSAAITIGFSKQDVLGAIFYWSTTSAGIRRANIAAARPRGLHHREAEHDVHESRRTR